MRPGTTLGKIPIIFLLINCCSCISGIHLLGIDKAGEKDLKVTKSKYSKRIGETLADIHDSALVPADKLFTSNGNEWRIKWFNIGMGIEGKVGIAGVATLAATPRIRLYFRKKQR
ncbi:MAG: hypothetical protein AB8G05_07920 [Oligoflexales bacterium]